MLAWGVAVAGAVQLALVAGAAYRDGFGLRLRALPRDPRLGRLFRLILPGAVGAGVYQINLVVDTWFASHLPPGAVSYLFYADRLNQLPLGLIGVALEHGASPGHEPADQERRCGRGPTVAEHGPSSSASC